MTHPQAFQRKRLLRKERIKSVSGKGQSTLRNWFGLELKPPPEKVCATQGGVPSRGLSEGRPAGRVVVSPDGSLTAGQVPGLETITREDACVPMSEIHIKAGKVSYDGIYNIEFQHRTIFNPRFG